MFEQSGQACRVKGSRRWYHSSKGLSIVSGRDQKVRKSNSTGRVIGLNEHLARWHEVCQSVGVETTCVHHEIHDLRRLR
jgi:hypothetical protein